MNTSMIEAPARRRRRRHSAEFRAEVVRACLQPGVSMASVALAHGLNATMLRKWVVDAEGGSRVLERPRPPASTAEVAPSPSFVALQLPTATVQPTIRIELQRAGTTVNVSWPASEAVECAAWLRELLR